MYMDRKGFMHGLVKSLFIGPAKKGHARLSTAKVLAVEIQTSLRL